MTNELILEQKDRAIKPSAILSAGTVAPDFVLRSTPDQVVSLREFRGKAVVLAFYPADWSPVCGDQMALYNEMLSEFKGLNAQLLGISVDGSWCHAAFSKDRKLHFPILADSEPKGAWLSNTAFGLTELEAKERGTSCHLAKTLLSSGQRA